MNKQHISLPARAALIVIRGYQLTLSAFLGRQCRFAPSCSDYASEAIVRHGAFRGGWLALKRIGRCNPWGGSGYDPVPDADQHRRKSRDGTVAHHHVTAAGGCTHHKNQPG